MVDKSPRIALLIDADNSPAAKIGVILNELSTFGETSIRRAYGNWKKQELRGWEEILHEHAIRPMQQFDYSKGKNASDMAMVI
ncbi:MAG: NYN domain-containing protein, partial [Caldimonas sp.]